MTSLGAAKAVLWLLCSLSNAFCCFSCARQDGGVAGWLRSNHDITELNAILIYERMPSRSQ